MPRKLRELRRDLRRAGFRIDRQVGSHEVWKHLDYPSIRGANIAAKDSADAKPYQEDEVRSALRDLEEAKRCKEES